MMINFYESSQVCDNNWCFNRVQREFEIGPEIKLDWKILKFKDVPSNFKIRDQHNFYELSS